MLQHLHRFSAASTTRNGVHRISTLCDLFVVTLFNCFLSLVFLVSVVVYPCKISQVVAAAPASPHPTRALVLAAPTSPTAASRAAGGQAMVVFTPSMLGLQESHVCDWLTVWMIGVLSHSAVCVGLFCVHSAV